QVAVLDYADAGLHRPRDRLGGVGVGAYILFEDRSLLDRRADLVRCVLQTLERIVGRGHTAGHHDLDVVHTLAQLLSRGAAAFVHPARDTERERHRVAARAGLTRVGAPPRIAVPARLADWPARHEEPRSRQVALRHALANAPVGAARVAYGREAAIEHR